MSAADLNPWVIVPMVVLSCVAGVALTFTLYPRVMARLPLRWKSRIGVSLQSLYVVVWMRSAIIWLTRKPFGDLGNAAMVVLMLAATAAMAFRIVRVFLSSEDTKNEAAT